MMSETKGKYDLDKLRHEFAALRKFAAMQEAQKDIVGCQKVYVDMTGNIEAALVLDEIVYFTLPRQGKISGLRIWKEGVLWMAVQRAEWWDRKRLTARQADAAIQKLVDGGLVIKAIFKFNGAPSTHLRLNIGGFFEKYSMALTEANPPEIEDDTLEKDLQDLYEMMQFPKSPNGKLRNGETELPNGNTDLPNGETELPNGNIFNSPHAVSTQTTTTTSDGCGAVFAAYQSEIGLLTSGISDMIGAAIDDYQSEWIIDAIKIAAKANKRSWRYVEGILKRWSVDGKGDNRKPPAVDYTGGRGIGI